MKKDKNKITSGMLIPITILAVLAFIFYTIVDTAILYDSIPIIALLPLSLVFIVLIFVMFRFYLTSFEYQIVGDELIIRRKSLFMNTRIYAYHLDSIESIGAIKRWQKSRYNLLKCPNRCSSIIPALFTGKVMVYRDYTTNKCRVAIIQPPDDIKGLLKLSLEERYPC